MKRKLQSDAGRNSPEEDTETKKAAEREAGEEDSNNDNHNKNSGSNGAKGKHSGSKKKKKMNPIGKLPDTQSTKEQLLHKNRELAVKARRLREKLKAANQHESQVDRKAQTFDSALSCITRALDTLLTEGLALLGQKLDVKLDPTSSGFADTDKASLADLDKKPKNGEEFARLLLARPTQKLYARQVADAVSNFKDEDDDDDDDSEDDSEDELVKLRRAQKLRQQQFGKPGLEPASSDDEDDSESEDELVKMRRAQKLRAQSKISTSTKENEDVSSDDDDDDDDDDEEDDEEEEEGDKLSKQLLRAAPNSSDEEDAEEDEDEDSEEEAQPEVSLVDELRDTLRDMPMQELAKLKREGLNGQPLHKALDLPGPEYINAWLSGNVDLDTIKAAAANNRKRSRPSTRGEQETAEDVDSGSDDDSNNVAEGSDGIHKTKKQRNAPKEISAKHQVSRFRHVIKAPNRERRDPRFMNMGGDKLDSNVFEGRYGFLEEMRDKEIDELNNALRSDRALKSKSKSARKHSNHRAMSEDERHAAMAKLTKMQQERSRSERDRSRRDIKRDLKKQELDKVAKGKKAFFTKEADLRKLELQKRYQDLQSKGKLDKFLEKRRKKLASKDRKILPKSRPPLGI
mmetsp:Transcript_21240/g.41656  ORF Transcript_21240/g.41656 Transcript_21240/m.41656 type:complete len:629 (+) Transcript_21240:771-2657(+)